MKEAEFVNGMYFNKRENAPDWVIGRLSINLNQFMEHAKDLEDHLNSKGYVDMDIKLSRKGNAYISYDNYTLERERERESKTTNDSYSTEAPF